MKKIFKGILAFSLIFLTYACKSGDPGYLQKPTDYSTYSNLAEALRSIGGIRVSGGNTLAGKQDVLIQIRGESTFVLNTQPLFVINNVPVGNNYVDANSIINMQEVVSIRVVTGIHAVTRWGEEGNHGVIMIKTREPDNKKKKG